MIHKGIRSARGMAMLMLLVSGLLPSACATAIDARPDLQPALDRYRYEFVKVHPGAVLPPSDPDYMLFAGAMRLVLGAYVNPTAPHLLVDRALEGMWARKESEPDASRHVLTEAAIDGMLSGLDPYSGFLDTEHVNNLREQMHGEYAGFGMDVAMDDRTGLLRVVSSDKNSPAARAGVRSGDLIVTINGQQVRGLTLNDVAARIRGPAGRAVDLQVLRPDGKSPVRISMIRTVFKVRPLLYRLDGDIAYVSIAYFNEQTAQSLSEAIETMRLQAGGRLAGAVLDLRNNPGGLLEQGIKVAGRFLGPAEIVSTRGRAAATQRYRAGDSNDVLHGAPLVVLINGFSSSSSEIVAGALQDYRRALLLGTRSYGKGTVQTVFWLPTGEGIRLTTAHYFRPSGASVECFGISPNVEIMPTPHMKGPLNPAPAVTALPDHAACDPTTAPPPPQRWSMADLCPEIARAASGTTPDVVLDVPLECALATIRTGRMMTAAQP